jgi:hypothetical protein
MEFRVLEERCPGARELFTSGTARSIAADFSHGFTTAFAVAAGLALAGTAAGTILTVQRSVKVSQGSLPPVWVAVSVG